MVCLTEIGGVLYTHVFYMTSETVLEIVCKQTTIIKQKYLLKI